MTEERMAGRRFRFLLLLPLCSCASASSNVSEPAPLGAPPPPVFLPSAVPDVAFGSCVAGVLSIEAEQHAHRLRRGATTAWLRATRADIRDQQASRAYAKAAASAIRSTNTASQQRQSSDAQVAANFANQKSAATLGSWRQAANLQMNAARAALGVSDSSAVAFRFASITELHEKLFRIEAASEPGQPDEQQQVEYGSVLEQLRETVASRPDLEFLYVDQFIRAYDAPPSRCTAREAH
jgi:hypothetical protein